jgi:transcriptional regulator with XRE-family HTH domain
MPKAPASSRASSRAKPPAPLAAQQLVARNMRRIRIGKRLTQEQVAEGSDTTPVWISGCERGARNLSVRSLSMIAYALKVPMSALLDEALDEAFYPEPPEGARVYAKREARTVRQSK